jgi:hypothetical protein
MKKFVYAALALGGLTQAAAGCVITTGSNDAEMDIAWLISGEGGDGDGCATIGATGVEVITERVSTRQREVDIFDCSTGAVLLRRPLGSYDVWANALDSQNRILGQSLIVEVDLNIGGEIRELPELQFRNGQFEATWQITNETTNQAETCSEVGAGGVSVLSTLAGSGGTGFDDIFPCPANDDEGHMVTAPLPLGDYTISVSILESGTDAALGTSQPRDGSIVNHATIVNLGLFEFFFL